ncbi:MAG: PTS sugar transporter subunit IIB [Treponema sp.]|jgi:PTS system galactitol-specific IIB component|nr:PTS sugar transporter subunit IIB [Treponema sp.]
MKAYRILVACGTGIATSTVIADRIKTICEKAGFKVNVDQCKVTQVEGLASSFDLIVASTQIPKTVTTPYIPGLSYLTGINREATDEAIVAKLKELDGQTA